MKSPSEHFLVLTLCYLADMSSHYVDNKCKWKTLCRNNICCGVAHQDGDQAAHSSHAEVCEQTCLFLFK